MDPFSNHVTRFVKTCFAENLTPAELKKLRDKQRKRAKKEAAEKQKQEELHRLQQQRNKAKNYDPDLDGPEQELLKPEKLAKVTNRFYICIRLSF